MIDRKHFGILLVSGAVALSAILTAVLSSTQRQADGDGALVTPVAAERQAMAPSADSDGDGVPNWKEALLKTDPLNADSDGDGTGDGDEIVLLADPRVSGTEPVSKKTYVAPSALSPTAALARELFASYAALRTSGSVDPNEIDAAIESLLARRAGSEEKPGAVRYALSDITVEEDVPVAAYAGALSAALKEADQVREYELSVFARVVEKNSETERQKLKASAAIYTNIQNKLLTMEVPPSVAGEHVAFVNGLAALAYEIERLSGWSKDPYEALLLLGAYGEAEDMMVASMSDLFTLVASLEKQT